MLRFAVLGRADARVEELHAMAGLRGDLRDAGAHRAGADDGDRRVSRRAARPCGQRPVNRGARLATNAATPSR